MILTAITRMLAITTVSAAALVFAAPSLAHLGYSSASKFGSAGSGVGQFNAPIGVAIDEGTDDVYVVDQGNNRVERFEADGKYLSEFNGSGTPAKAFEAPTYVAVDNSGDAGKGHVYVADPSQGVVDAFDATGKYLFQINVVGLEAIATDKTGHLWVWTKQASFEEYSETGTLILRQPIGRGTKAGVVVDSNDNVYVLYGSEKIGKYSPPSYVEDNESGPGEARTLAIDPATNKIFQDNGSSIIEWPPFGEGPGLWEGPEETFSGGLTNSYGLAINGKTGTLYASDESANDVEVFRVVVTPDVTTGSTSELTASSATIEGTVNPDKTKTTSSFEWGETESYGQSTALEEAGEGETAIPVSAKVGGLDPNTTYHYRIVASNENGMVHGLDRTFTTLPVPPVVEGAPTASNETRSSAVLHATINPKHSSTTFHFSYVEEADYEPAADNPYAAGGVTDLSNVGSAIGGQAIEQALPGLKPNTTYHYEVVAISQAGLATGPDATFTTGAATPPVSVTGGSIGVGENSATIGGALTTGGLPTSYGFEIGVNNDYGPPTGLGTVGAGLSEAPVSLSLAGLLPGTTYHYRLTATNVDGTSYGEDRTFATGVFASTFATPPAPLPFVTVPSILFPVDSKPVLVKKKASKPKGKKVKKRGKAKSKKKVKSRKKR